MHGNLLLILGILSYRVIKLALKTDGLFETLHGQNTRSAPGHGVIYHGFQLTDISGEMIVTEQDQQFPGINGRFLTKCARSPFNEKIKEHLKILHPLS